MSSFKKLLSPKSQKKKVGGERTKFEKEAFRIFQGRR